MHEIKPVYLLHTREFYKLYFNYRFNHYTCYLKKTCQYPVFEIFLKAIVDRFIPSSTLTNFKIQNYKRLEWEVTNLCYTLSSFTLKLQNSDTESCTWELLLLGLSIFLSAFVFDNTWSLLFFKRQSSARVEVIYLPCNVLFNCFSLIFMQTNQFNP